MAKILVLDNDETIGCYYHFFRYTWAMLTTSTSVRCEFDEIIQRIVHGCINCRVFRPGLFSFLATVKHYKQIGTLHKLVMYTNAIDIGTRWEYKPGHKFTFQQLITYCLGTMVNDVHLFDEIIIREPHKHEEDYPTKSFSRLRTCLHLNPEDQIMFYEDRPADVLDATANDTILRMIPYSSRVRQDTAIQNLSWIYHALVTQHKLEILIARLLVDDYFRDEVRTMFEEKIWQQTWNVPELHRWVVG